MKKEKFKKVKNNKRVVKIPLFIAISFVVAILFVFNNIGIGNFLKQIAQSKDEAKATASATIYGQTVTGVSKTGTLNNFANGIPAGTVFLDKNKLFTRKLSTSDFTLQTNGNTGIEYTTITFTGTNLGMNEETSKVIVYKGPNGNGIAAGSEGYLTNSGISKTASASDRSTFSLTFKNAATMQDGTTRNVKVTYSNIYIVNQRSDKVPIMVGWSGLWTQVALFKSNGAGMEAESGAGFGMHCDITISVLNNDGTAVSGQTMLFEANDLDVSDYTRLGDNKKLYPKIEDDRYPSTYGNMSAYSSDYRESLQILSGALSDAYMPADNKLEVRRIADGTNANGLRFSSYGGNADGGTLNSGFLMLANAGNLKIRWYGSVGSGAGMGTQIFNSEANHYIKATSGAGGLIRTDYSFPSGTTYTVNSKNSSTGSFQHNFADGSTVNYIMTPDTNYRLKNITIDSNSFSPTDFNSVAANASNQSVNVTKSGTTYTFKVSKSATGRITNISYTFSNNNANHNISVTWEKIPATVIVRHYIEGTTTAVPLKNGGNAAQETKSGSVGDSYTTSKVTTPDYYELVSTPSNATGTMTEATITVTYYYRLKKYPYTVNYYDIDTNEKIKDTKTGGNTTWGTSIASSSEVVNITKYDFTRADKTTLTISENTGNNVINLYYTKKKGNVVVKYIGINDSTNTQTEISTQTTKTDKVDETYTTEPKSITGWEVVRNSGNTTGIYTLDSVTTPIEVIYYYKKKTKVTVKHIDIFLKDTGDVIEENTEENQIYVGDEYNGLSKNFPGYMLNRGEPTQKTITLKENPNDNIIIFYYRYESAGVLEKHINYITNEIIEETLHSGLEGELYGPIESKDFTGYTLLQNVLKPGQELIDGEKYNIPSNKTAGRDIVDNKLPTNKQGRFTIALQEVKYYYVYPTKVTTKFIDDATGEEIETSVVTNGYETDPYTTEPKNIDNYDLAEDKLPTNSEGQMTKNEIIVEYRYRRKTKVIVDHIDKISGNKLTETEEIPGHVQDNYSTNTKVFEGYDVVEVPNNASGTMTRDEIHVIYYYKKKAKVTVEHIDKITGETLKTEEINGYEKDPYETHEKEFEGYDLVTEELPNNGSGEMIPEGINVVYYYKKKAKVIVKHIDKIKGTELIETEVINGHQDDDYRTTEKEFDGYGVVEIPENKEGKMTPEDIEVIYYYKKKAKATVEHKDKITDQLIEKEDLEGYEDDIYETVAKKYDQYNVVEKPENPTIKMTPEGVTVTYYYKKIGKVIPQYIDKITGEIITKEEINGYEKDEYKTEEKEIDGYVLVKEELPENAEGLMIPGEIKVNYYYIYPTEVTIEHIDKDTGKPLVDPETKKGNNGEEYKSEQKDIEYYKLVEMPSNASGTMTKEKIEVKYYYVKKEFNLKVDKWIEKISINGVEQNGKKYETKDELFKAEISRKKIANADVRVTYKIKISNTGEIEGYVQELNEYLPDGFEFKQEDNEINWTNTDNVLTTEDLKGEKLNPGQSKEISITLRWKNNKNNFGQKVNKVKLNKLNNPARYEDINENDNESKSEMLLSLTTGLDGADKIQIIKILVPVLSMCVVGLSIIIYFKKKQQ